MDQLRSAQFKCIALLLRPVVRFCFRRSQSFQDFVEAAKFVFVDVAREEMSRSNQRVNANRVSIATGINRNDVSRFFKGGENELEGLASVPSRVIARWEQDQRYQTKAGKPRALSYDGENSEFFKLVDQVSKHVNPGSILAELERAEIVKKSGAKLRLLKSQVLFLADKTEVFRIISMNIDSLIESAMNNIEDEAGDAQNHHLRTEYDNIYVKDLPEVREWLWREGKKFHHKVRTFLSKFDKDVVPSPKGKDWKAGAQVTFCAFSNIRPDFSEENN